MDALERIQSLLRVQEDARVALADDLQRALVLTKLRLLPADPASERQVLQVAWEIEAREDGILHLLPGMKERLRAAAMDPTFGLSKKQKDKITEQYFQKPTPMDTLCLKLWETARESFEEYVLAQHPELEGISTSLRMLIPSVMGLVFDPRAAVFEGAMQLLIPRMDAEEVRSGPALFSVNEIETSDTGAPVPNWAEVPVSQKVRGDLDAVKAHLFLTLANLLFYERDLDTRST